MILYATWGRKSGSQILADYNWSTESMNRMLLDDYQKAANLYGAQVSPVGDRFLYITQNHPKINLHQNDLVQPTFVMDHPIEISPLTKKKPENPDYVERCEFFMNGLEMANAYSELNDPIDQRERFKAQEELLAQGDEEANTTDEDFLYALELGMPPTGGIGFGIDRMTMLLTDSQAIRDVILFPTMKPLD